MFTDEHKKKLKTQKELCKIDAENEKAQILQLSDVVLVMIFQNLDTFSQVIASKVCRKWYHISQDKTLVHSFDLRTYPVTLQQLWKISHRKLSKSTTSIHLRGKVSSKTKVMEKLTHAYLKDLFKRCGETNNLSLEYFDMLHIPLDLLADNLSPNLMSLSLSGSMLPLQWFEGFKQRVIFPNLKVLNLHSCSKVSNIDLESISYIGRLEKLILCNCYRISARGIPSIAKNLKNLKYLDVSRCPAMNDVSLFHISNLPLTELRTQFCHLITDNGVGFLFKESSRTRTTLKRLNLYSCHELTNKCLEIIELEANNLLQLDIGGCAKISIQRVELFKETLLQCDVRNVFINAVGGDDCDSNETNHQSCSRLKHC